MISESSELELRRPVPPDPSHPDGIAFTRAKPHAVTHVDGVQRYWYDPAGNMTSRDGAALTWDGENRLVSINQDGRLTTLVYDADGRRVKKVTPWSTTYYIGEHYEKQIPATGLSVLPGDVNLDCQVSVADIQAIAAHWGQAWSVQYDVDQDGSAIDAGDIQTAAANWWASVPGPCDQATTKYYRLGGRLVALRKNGQLRYVHTDHLGSVSLLTDDSGQVVPGSVQRFYPFGKVRAGQPVLLPTERNFTGQQLDANTGLLYYGARYYDPALGRWTQPDTIVPNPGNPQDLNRYSYVRNSPLRYTDPTGRYIFEEEPEDYFFIPPSRSPTGQAIRMVGDTCFGECTGAPLTDPQTTAIVQTAIAVLWEPADWAMTFYAWSQGDFSWWDLTGLLPILPATVRRNADELQEVGDIVYRVVRPDEHPGALIRGFRAKDPSRRVHPQRHVTHGRQEASNWISTTRDLDWARRFQGEEPIYMIDLSKVDSLIVDTTKPGVTEGWYWRARILATRASEVLIDTYIPPEAIRGVIP